MSSGEELGLGGLAVLGSVCAVLLRSTHQNLKTLDTLRREADAAAEKLRQELHDHDETIFELQAACADYRLTIARLEQQNQRLHKALRDAGFPPLNNSGESYHDQDVL